METYQESTHIANGWRRDVGRGRPGLCLNEVHASEVEDDNDEKGEGSGVDNRGLSISFFNCFFGMHKTNSIAGRNDTIALGAV